MPNLTIAVLGVTCLQGCSAVGLAVGAATPKTEPVASGGLVAGERVMVDLRESDDEGHDVVRGRYVRNDPAFLVLDASSERTQVAHDRIEQVRVVSGSHWLTGLLVGAVLDAAAITTMTFMYAGASHKGG